jgi:hypothetical protein
MRNLQMKQFDMLATQLTDTAAESVLNRGHEEAALESHLDGLRERLRNAEKRGGPAREIADVKLQMARTLASLDRGTEAWPLGREAFDYFLSRDDFELAADACDVLFQAEQPESISALGQGIWLAVTCPIDPELTIELLHHVVEETPDEADGAAVAATTALFLADVRANGRHRDDLMFFATQILGTVARRHSGVETAQELDLWMDRLELKEPERFLVRLRNVVDVLVQDDWWFDRDALQARLPLANPPSR